MLKEYALKGLLIASFLSGCGETKPKNNDKDNTKIITNGLQELSTESRTNIFAFIMDNEGYVTISAHHVYCHINLIDNKGKVQDEVKVNKTSINKLIPKGKYYIEVKAKNELCSVFNLFSPMIIDDYTNENQNIITNGKHDI